MSHAHDHDPTVPRGALIGIAVLLLSIMAMTGAVKLGFVPLSANPEASRSAEHVIPAQERALLFADRADGAVLVTDASNGATVGVIAFGEGGFARATLRRLAKARKAAGYGPETPFVLTRWSNGALSLRDPKTNREAEIYGFGKDHVAVFAAMLKDAES